MIRSMGCIALYLSDNFEIFQQKINSPRAFREKREKIRISVHRVIFPRESMGITGKFECRMGDGDTVVEVHHC